MESNIFKYILRYSKPQQVIMLVVTGISFPFLYASLELPKTIINQAIGGSNFPREYFGFALEQIPYLLVLCGIFLALVFVNGGFKYYINVYRGVVAERMLRRLRYQLIERVMRFPLLHFRKVSQGEIVSMVATETEPLGGFIGDAFSMPAFQGGTLITILAFMFVQDWTLGLAAIALYPVQAYLIPKLQRQVNALGKERVRNVRKFAERIGETVSGATEIRAHETAHYELADFSDRLGKIFEIRYKIYRKKFFIKFINNFLAQLTPFFFFSIGGYLVIVDDLTFGALVAILAAYKDLSGPWKMLLNYYQRMEDARIKYEQLVEQFQPPGMLDEELVTPLSGPAELLEGSLIASNLTFEDDGAKIVDSASFAFDTQEHVSVVGQGGGGRTAVAQLMARQLEPTGGRILVGEKNLATVHGAFIGRRFAYVEQDSYIRSGSIRDTLLYGVKHHPTLEKEGDGEGADIKRNKLQESIRSGNSPFDIDAQWIDYDAMGVSGKGELDGRIIECLRIVEMEDDVFQIGLRQIIDPASLPELADGVLEARAVINRRLTELGLTDLVELFDKEKYNTNASVAENIIFGSPAGADFEIESLGANPFVLKVLEKAGLSETFLEMGQSIASLMIELFRDLPPGHEFFERFGFIDSDELPEFQRALNHVAAQGLDALDDADRSGFVELPFKLITARHNLNLIDEPIQKRILEARAIFAEDLPEDQRASVAFFEIDKYNTASSIQDNILFGKTTDDRAQGASRIGELVADAIDEFGLRESVLEVGLGFDVGIAGKRLSATQRQKLALARCLLKRPDIMVVNEAIAILEISEQKKILANLREELKERGLVWVESGTGKDGPFKRVLSVDRGKVTDSAAEVEAARPETPEAPAQGEQAAAGQDTSESGLNTETSLLAEIPFFSGMERSKLKLLAFTSHRETFSSGDILFSQGDMGDKTYVLVEGNAEVIVDTAEGKPTVVATLGQGDLVGELALLCEGPRTATVKATTELDVLVISKDIFSKLIEENSDVSAKLIRIVAGRLESTLLKLTGGEALYDDLTGLPNRELLMDRIKHRVSADQREGWLSALILVDLAGIEAVRDLSPGEVRDRLFEEIARKLRQNLRQADTLAHIEGFGFGIVANASPENKTVHGEAVTDRMTEILAGPFDIDGEKIVLEGGVNFKIYPLDEENLRLAYEAIQT